ncbi:MAG: PDGLE domain-containing protein [Candidatus Planktophila sp.]
MDKNKRFLFTGLLVSLFLAGVVSYYASSSPDGLEKVAGEIGFIDTAKDHTNSEGTLADYGVKGIENERASVGIAGVIGVIGTAVIGGVLFQLIVRKPKARK